MILGLECVKTGKDSDCYVTGHLVSAEPPFAAEVNSVWVVYYGNYYPRELDSIWATEELAKARCEIDPDLNCEEWAVLGNGKVKEDE